MDAGGSLLAMFETSMYIERKERRWRVGRRSWGEMHNNRSTTGRPKGVFLLPACCMQEETERVSSSRPTEFAPLPDGRTVWQQDVAGRPRLVVVEPGHDAVPLTNTSEPTMMPVLAGPGLLAFVIRSSGKEEIGIASLATGQILRRMAFDKGSIDRMISSPDGKMLYCVAGHAVWAVSSAGGAPLRVHDGDGVAIDPDGRYLAVIVLETASAHLYKVPLDGGAEHEIAVSGRFRLTPFLGTQAIDRDGRLLAGLTSADSWFYYPGIIDLSTGRVMPIPTDLRGDYLSLSWTGGAK